MEKAERDFLVRYLALTRERMLDAIDGLNKEQLGFHPAPNRWSVADCLEHVTLVERAVLRTIQKTLMQNLEPHIGSRVRDDEILHSVPHRLPRLVSAPEFVPARRSVDFDDLVRQFEAARERTLRFAAVTSSDLRAHFFAHERFGELDCYQWLLYTAAHSERHARQAVEIAADPMFPRELGSATA
jgi:uncharacterized damage-inducible protein DinB